MEFVSGTAKQKLFMESGKKILIQGNCSLCGFQNSEDVRILGSCKKSNFDHIFKFSVDGNVSECVFNKVDNVVIVGTAKKCTFVNIDRRNISISGGTGKGCTLNGEPLNIESPIAQKVFSFGAGPSVNGAPVSSRANAPREIKRVQPQKTERRDVFVVEDPLSSGRGGAVVVGGGNSATIAGVKIRGISWPKIVGKGGMMMRGYTVELTGPGTIGDIPVPSGRYAKRLGDDKDTLYRQDLSANPNSSPWQVYINGQWFPTSLTPTIN